MYIVIVILCLEFPFGLVLQESNKISAREVTDVGVIISIF
jgi:hypothetical protein